MDTDCVSPWLVVPRSPRVSTHEHWTSPDDSGDPSVDEVASMRSLGVWCPLCVALALGFADPSAASADGPTSDDVSLWSGRTVDEGDIVLAGGIGWPGVFAEALFAPSSRFNVSLRIDVDWGSPLLGFDTALGGELSLPMRLHVYGKGSVDLALAARPFGMLGEGAAVGQVGVFSDNIGGGAGLEVGLRSGFRVSERVTLGASPFASFALVRTSGAGTGAVGVFGLMGSLEANMSRATMLFVMVGGGYGVASEALFDSRGMVRLAIGLAYRL